MAMAQQANNQDEKKKEEALFTKYKQKYLNVTCQDKINCSFHKWYKKFRKQTIRSRIIPINNTFIDYLKQDGLKLPPQIQNEMDDYYDLDSDNDDDYNKDIFWNNNNNNNNNQNNSDNIDYTQLDDIFSKIREKIDVLKTGVVPKLNWSCPSDAKWINNETLKCDNITQILLLLKSSQFIQHDLCYPFHGCVNNNNNNNKLFQYKLILRKYSNLYPNREFRCFVFNNSIIAIVQRNDSDYFAELEADDIRMKIIKSINIFYKTYVFNVFGLNNFVFDVYLDKIFKVFIIDFNPFYEYTDCGCLFSWIDICKFIEERQQMNINDIDNEYKSIKFGYVDSNNKKMRFNPNSQYRYPIDAVDLSNQNKIKQFVDSCKNNDK